MAELFQPRSKDSRKSGFGRSDQQLHAPLPDCHFLAEFNYCLLCDSRISPYFGDWIVHMQGEKAEDKSGAGTVLILFKAIILMVLEECELLFKLFGMMGNDLLEAKCYKSFAN